MSGAAANRIHTVFATPLWVSAVCGVQLIEPFGSNSRPRTDFLRTVKPMKRQAKKGVSALCDYGALRCTQG